MISAEDLRALPWALFFHGLDLAGRLLEALAAVARFTLSLLW